MKWKQSILWEIAVFFRSIFENSKEPVNEWIFHIFQIRTTEKTPPFLFRGPSDSILTLFYGCYSSESELLMSLFTSNDNLRYNKGFIVVYSCSFEGNALDFTFFALEQIDERVNFKLSILQNHYYVLFILEDKCIFLLPASASNTSILHQI